MIFLHTVDTDDAALFQDTSYAAMSPGAMEGMIEESLAQSHGGRYFEMLAVMDDKVCVGFVSLYEREDGAVSCGPEIKPQYRRQGYGYVAVWSALERAKRMGYSKAVAQVRRDNDASIALHQKLGFAQCRSYVNKKGHPVLEFEKDL